MSTLETPTYPEKIDAAVLKVAGVVVLGAIMSILDITVVNVALPTFQSVFGSAEDPIAYSHVAWTVTAYTLALATVIPLTGWAADRAFAGLSGGSPVGLELRRSVDGPTTAGPAGDSWSCSWSRCGRCGKCYALVSDIQ